MGRMSALMFGLSSYLVFLVVCLYSIGFVGNMVVPKTIDSGAAAPFLQALLVNVLLLGLFAIPHSVMARPAFKTWWTRAIPSTIERSIYVLLSSLLLSLLYWQWRAMLGVVWSVEIPVARVIMQTLYWIGWLIVVLSTFMIDHFDFFGLRQVHLYNRYKPLSDNGLKTPALYRYVRHPIMLGFLVAFWATPRMTTGHFVFALASSGYILLGIHYEERDLVSVYGNEYQEYRRRVPMLLPLPWKN